jgi:hypothetical protein
MSTDGVAAAGDADLGQPSFAAALAATGCRTPCPPTVRASDSTPPVSGRNCELCELGVVGDPIPGVDAGQSAGDLRRYPAARRRFEGRIGSCASSSKPVIVSRAVGRNIACAWLSERLGPRTTWNAGVAQRVG